MPGETPIEQQTTSDMCGSSSQPDPTQQEDIIISDQQYDDGKSFYIFINILLLMQIDRFHKNTESSDPLQVIRTIGIRRHFGREKHRSQRRVTMAQFYSSRFSIRPHVFSPILYGARLFQQYAIDSFSKIE